MGNMLEPVGLGGLPPWNSVLAVVAHPDDESFGLGAILDAFVQAEAAAQVLCFTRGEASTLQGVPGDLSKLREAELERASDLLGIGSTVLGAHPDGGLSAVDPGLLVEEVLAVVDRFNVDGILVFDPSGISGHPDHIAATAAGLAAAQARNLPALGWTVPLSVAHGLNEEFEAGFIGHKRTEIDLVIQVSRDRQRLASLAHASQALPTSVLWRRLELLGEKEYLRWLRIPG